MITQLGQDFKGCNSGGKLAAAGAAERWNNKSFFFYPAEHQRILNTSAGVWPDYGLRPQAENSSLTN